MKAQEDFVKNILNEIKIDYNLITLTEYKELSSDNDLLITYNII